MQEVMSTYSVAVVSAALLAFGTSPAAGGCTLELALVDGVIVPWVRMGLLHGSCITRVATVWLEYYGPIPLSL